MLVFLSWIKKMRDIPLNVDAFWPPKIGHGLAAARLQGWMYHRMMCPAARHDL